MTTKRKPRTKRPRKKKKVKSAWSRPWVWVALLLPLMAASYLVYTQKDAFLQKPEADLAAHNLIQGVLVAGGIDPERDIQKVTDHEDGVERWKIQVRSPQEKNRLMRGMRMAVTATAGTWKSVDEARREKSLVHLAEVRTDEGNLIRLLFVVPEAKRQQPRRKLAKKPPAVSKAEKSSTAKEEIKREIRPKSTGPFEQPTIAIILDDIGQKKVSILKPLLDLKFPITFAVMPFLPYTRDNAIYLHRNQYEVMLHMPMEPDGYPKNNPGKGAIFAHFTANEIQNAVSRAIEDVPFIKGVNNHMGSKVTASRALMRPVLEEVRKNSLFYIDSRTNSTTVAHKLASTMGLRTAKRDVFLDSVDTYSFSVKQLEEAARVADKKGSAIVIGHPYPTTIAALVEELPKMNQKGYRFVFASTLVEALAEQL